MRDIDKAEWATMSVAHITSGKRSKLRQTQLFEAKLALYLRRVDKVDINEFTLGALRKGSYIDLTYSLGKLKNNVSKRILKTLRKRIAIPSTSKHVTTSCTFDIKRGKVATYMINILKYKEIKEYTINGKLTSFRHLEGC